MSGRRLWKLIAAIGLGSFVASAFAQSKLQLQVYTGRGESGYDVNSTLISGEKDMLLIDAQFSLPEAHRLAALMRFRVATHANLIPGPDPVVPEESTEPFLTLEGEQFQVTGDIGFDHAYFPAR